MNDPERQHIAKQILIALIVILTFAALVRILVAGAQEPRADVRVELSADTQTLLAQAVVGEAGWKPAVDHDVIPWLLYARWRHIGGGFDAVIHQYCKALSGSRPWLLELDAEGTQPANWPTKASWAHHKPKWLKIRARIGDWAHGKVANPCPRAVHFGGAMDAPSRAMVPARCAGSVNRFWDVRRG
jgi:hypothetical protein